MQLVVSGQPAAVVPVEYQRLKMTLYKGEDALAARRHVASKLTDSAIRELRPLEYPYTPYTRRYTASVALPTRAPAGPFYTPSSVPLGAIGL